MESERSEQVYPYEPGSHPPHAQTPSRSRNTKPHQPQHSLHGDSNGRSEQAKSFLVLSTESSPITNTYGSTTTFASKSENPTMTTSSMNALASSRMGPDIAQSNQSDAESSFFSMTSPLASRMDYHVGEEDNVDDRDQFEAYNAGLGEVITPVRRIGGPKSVNSRGSRLGAQMGRSKSNQQSSTSLQSSPAESLNSPPLTNYYGPRAVVDKSVSPTKIVVTPQGQESLKGAKQYVARTNSDWTAQTNNQPQGRNYQERFTGKVEGVSSMAARWDNIASTSNTRPSIKGSSGPSRTTEKGVVEIPRRMEEDLYSHQTEPSALSPAAFSRSNAVFDQRAADQSNSSMSPTLPSLQEQSYESHRRLSRTSSHGDIYSAASSSPRIVSPDRMTGVGNAMGMARVGRLSRLQYNKGDAAANNTAGPGWDMTHTTSKNGTSFKSKNSLLGRASNPSLLTDFTRGESSSDPAQKAHSSQQSSISSNAPDVAATQSSSINDHSSNSSTRTGERRELLLPALNGMRNAVQSVVATPTESFMKRGDRRRSFLAMNQSSGGGLAMHTTPTREERGLDDSHEEEGGWRPTQQLSPTSEANAIEKFHDRTPSMDTNPSPAMTEDTWQRTKEANKSNHISLADQLSMGSSPIHKSMGMRKENHQEAMLPGARHVGKVGQLSDEAIVSLGAVPGVEPSSLLNSNGQPLSSKNILTIALQKAQSAVMLDSSNNVPDAIMAYRQAVRLLEEVMERVSPKHSTKSSRKNSREEERRRLKVIHDTYADRIRLLSMIYSPEDEVEHKSPEEEDDSFTLQNPSSLPASNSYKTNESRGLAIGGQETEIDRQETPKIAISAEPVSSLRGEAEDNEEVLRESSKDIRETSLHRSDSDSSFRSAQAQGPSATKANAPSGLQQPADRFRMQSNMLGVGGAGVDDDLATPATPYFDIDPLLVSAAEETAAVQREAPLVHGSGLAVNDSGSNYFMAEGQRSRQPQDRINRGITSLDNVPSARAIADHETHSSLPSSSRKLLSVGSDALFQEPPVSQPPSTSYQRKIDEGNSKTTTDEIIDREVTSKISADQASASALTPRARATTIGEMQKPTEVVRNLVSNNVSSGTISQRRKMSAVAASSSKSEATGGSDEDLRIDSRNLARSSSQSPTDMETVRDRNAAAAADRSSSPVAMAVTTDDDDREPRTGTKAMTTNGRKRAISQPSNRRPSIPASFMMNNQNPPGSPHGPPPVPRITRKASMPLSPLFILQSNQQQQQQGTIKATTSSAMASSGNGSGASGFRFPSPAPSTSSGYHALGTPATPYPLYPWSMQTIGGSGGGNETKGDILSDIFASSLPSLQMGAIPSFTSNSQPVSLPWIGITNSLPDINSISLPPAQKNLRPFHTMKLLHASIERGAYITKRLYLPRDLWLQQGSRLLAIESKVRMLESISSGIDGIDQAGHFLLYPTYSDQPGLNAINASKFLKLLEEFETLLVELQNNLAKKLGFLETVTGKKANTSFGSFGSKLTRSLDRMTNNSKHLDTPVTYVEGLSRLFIKSQVLGNHLSTLYRSKRQGEDYNSPTRDGEWDSLSVDNYATLPAELKGNIEIKLKRFSEFFTNVVLRFVLRDVAILMDKSVKRNTALLTE